MLAGKVPIPPLHPTPGPARAGSINLLVFKRSDTLEPHRCHLSLEAAVRDEWCSFLRDLCWMPHPHPSPPGFMGCNPSPSTRASDMAVCHLMLRLTQADRHWQRQMVRVGRRVWDRWMDVWPEWLALCWNLWGPCTRFVPEAGRG